MIKSNRKVFSFSHKDKMLQTFTLCRTKSSISPEKKRLLDFCIHVRKAAKDVNQVVVIDLLH